MWSIHPSVSPSVCDVCLSVTLHMHCGAQDQFRGLKVVPLCSYQATSYSLLQT